MQYSLSAPGMHALAVQATAATWKLGGAVRCTRMRQGLTQKAFAQQLEVGPSTLAQWERGDH